MIHGGSRPLLASALVLSSFVVATACKSSPKVEPPISSPPSFESPAPKAEKVDETTGFQEVKPTAETVAEGPSSLAEKLNTQKVLKTIYFDFDKYDLRTDAVRGLGDNAEKMKQYSQFKVRIEGHCDERGTVEYNLALGEKRARAARDYLASLGVPASRMRIISFGKERPVDPGHNEDAWAKNRRDEFIFLAE